MIIYTEDKIHFTCYYLFYITYGSVLSGFLWEILYLSNESNGSIGPSLTRIMLLNNMLIIKFSIT